MRRADPVAAAAARRGTVLGLTLAEVMLLLCFCLAMAAAAGIAQERTGRQAAERDLARAEADAARAGTVARGLVEAEAARTGTPVDDLWRRLVPAGAAGARTAQGPAGAAPAPPSAPGEGARVGRAAAPDAPPPATASSRDPPGKEAAKETAKETEGLVARAGAALSRLGRGLMGHHDWPPIVTLSEAGGFRFASGASALSPTFAEGLRKAVIPRLVETARDYDVDVIEVIGHTDGQPVGGSGSNLDGTLVEALRGHVDPSALRAGDNAGLGLARAATVAAALRRDPRLDGYRIVPLSAGQAVGPDLRLGTAGADARLRRIEIRMRKAADAPG